MNIRLIAFGGLVAFVVAFFATGANSQFAAIKELEEALAKALEKTRLKQYSPYKSSISVGKTHEYHASKIVFEPRGMGPLYNATHVILDSVIGEKAFPDGLITVQNHEVVISDDALDDWSGILQHYAAILAIVVFGLLFAIIMPIVGFCFCCCRCAGMCGARSQPFDKKHDTCRRVYLGLLLILVATAMVFGVVVAFVTNSYMQEGVENAPQAARYVTKDATLFLNDTSSHMNHLLVENFIELKDNTLHTLDESATIVIQQLANQSKAVSLKQLNDVAKMLPDVQKKLGELKKNTNELQLLASQVTTDLRSVKKNLLLILQGCGKVCLDLLNQYVSRLNTTLDYSHLPDATQVIMDLDVFVNGNDLQNEIENGINEFNSINTTLQNAVDKNVGSIEDALNNAGKEIRQQSQSLRSSIDNIKGTAENEGDRLIQIADDYIKEYSQYRYYGGLALSIVLLLVLLCVSFGLLCGICGKRPDGYGDDCCNKGAGSTFLMCGVALMFLSAIVLAVVALAHFLVGLLVHRAVCVPLQNPQNDQVFGIFEQIVDLDQIIHAKSNLRVKTPGALNLSAILGKCHRNQSAYEVFSLDKVLSSGNIDDLLGYADRFGIGDLLKEIADDFTFNTNITIISQSGLQKLMDLQSSSLNSFQFYRFADELNETLTNIPLDELASKLQEAAKQLDNTDKNTANELRNQANKIISIQNKSLKRMVSLITSLKTVANELETSLKFNTDSFSIAIKEMIDEVVFAQDFLRNQGADCLKKMIEEVTKSIENATRGYLKHVVYQTKTTVGQCGPLSQVYNSTLVAVCNNVLDPFNGYWAGLGWCILLFVPCIILSVKLSGLYQKSDPYPGPLVESEYLYDAYADRDNISLTSPPEGKRRSKDKKHDRHMQRESSAQGPSASHDHRYTDMARKQWDDYSEDAPPRYHSPPLPPSEYERPPPYYYPGPASDRSPSVN